MTPPTAKKSIFEVMGWESYTEKSKSQVWDSTVNKRLNR